ncbi:PTS sugar transporter subunit IIC [Limosilactobacillus reuteri]|uniref:PTS sugar transporter subunit IIC n=5 Tax=Limosilactobacillus reuteri TaxID=1598 RepID=A0AAJ1MG90_LIMRT|nr:PTS sugar transporter subunit IIC [Limosilactobacillus reuteri]MCT3201473.1 PTS sugar transporter subunit IIC [Limosilactobacillus reuteri]MCT3203800.1 PTS sugar transporter subunit IIC [Limosilactobacillus reuteri]MCT3211540.1 PTS sugar transporter subunit IIC [Limosilactobacillus reuteri]MDC6077009.1 PTS sugar transporter subunit IIC [Limosilactobacillus reuteri]MDV8947425.1 PTS sugar transporter subunit IIC [Limosilactobacillus reuteri]
MTFNCRSDKLTTIIKRKINYKEALMMENQVSNSKANATYQNSSKVKEVAYRIFAAVANAILVVLGGGLLTQTIGNLTGIHVLTLIGGEAQALLAPAIGVAVASQMNTNTLVTFASMVAATVGSNGVHFTDTAVKGMTATGQVTAAAAGAPVLTTGQPVSAVLAAIVAVLVGKYLTGKTPLDMVLVPFGALAVGIGFGLVVAAVVTPALLAVSAYIAHSMQVSPVLGSMVISVVWALFLMTPASSAALAVALMLDPISSAAALIGTTAQFVGFTAMSFRQNNLGANIAQGLVTPKVQFPNLLINPYLLVPTVVSAAVCAPIATVLFDFRSTSTLGGLGLNSLIAPIAYLSRGWAQFSTYMVFGVVVPAVLSIALYLVLKRAGFIGEKQLHLELV